MNNLADLEIMSVELHRERLMSQKVISAEQLASCRVNFTNHAAFDMDMAIVQLILDLPTELLGEYIETDTHAYPDGWWQWFRDKWFPRWWLKKYPVQMKTITLKTVFKPKAIYPQLPLVFPKCGTPRIRIDKLITLTKE